MISAKSNGCNLLTILNANSVGSLTSCVRLKRSISFFTNPGFGNCKVLPRRSTFRRKTSRSCSCWFMRRSCCKTHYTSNKLKTWYSTKWRSTTSPSFEWHRANRWSKRRTVKNLFANLYEINSIWTPPLRRKRLQSSSSRKSKTWKSTSEAQEETN